MQKFCFKKTKKQLYKRIKGYSLMAKLPVSEIGNRGSNPLILEFQNYLSKKTYTYEKII